MNVLRGWLTAVLVVVVSSSALAEDDDCVMNPAALKPQVDATKLPKGWKLVKAERVERTHRERFALPGGTELVVQISGCAHLGLTFTVKSKIAAKLRPADAVELLKKLSSQTPFLPDAHFGQPIMRDAFAALKQAPAAFPIALECGKYETCEISQSAEGVAFGYDFPL
jgi:hypothetical protein